jgi:hypothetical protein
MSKKKKKSFIKTKKLLKIILKFVVDRVTTRPKPVVIGQHISSSNGVPILFYDKSINKRIKRLLDN